MSDKIVYSKLVRDKIPEIIEANGALPKTRVLGAIAHRGAIRDKFSEEFREFDEAELTGDKEHILGEIVDLQELVDALTISRGFTLAERHRAQMQKRDERGGFEEGIFLESTESKAGAQLTTLETYDTAAPALAEFFRGIGSRIEDIERAIDLLGKSSDISVLELGCGDGRDGEAIAERVTSYKGIDYSAGMIAIANQSSPELDFSVGDMLTTDFPPNQDIIFAFASFLHLDRHELKIVLDKCMGSLAEGGILYMSLKEMAHYTPKWQKDEYGERLFYFYNPDEVAGLVNPRFSEVHRVSYTRGSTDWFEQAFQKPASETKSRA